MRSTLAHAVVLAVIVLVGSGSSIFAQDVPWKVFLDPQSSIACDLVNAGNLELVVLSDTGALVVVTGIDFPLDEAASVNEDGVFFFAGIPVGAISFADDGDGFRTLWLLDVSGNVLELNSDTGAPIFTHRTPDDFLGVPCDAFTLWDDDDFDGVTDDFDDCPETPQDELAEDGGCSCSQLDSDGDGVDDCFDECLDTPLGADVDSDGCEIIVVVQPPPVTVVQPPITVVCGSFSGLTLAMTFGALVTLRLIRRRHS